MSTTITACIVSALLVASATAGQESSKNSGPKQIQTERSIHNQSKTDSTTNATQHSSLTKGPKEAKAGTSQVRPSPQDTQKLHARQYSNSK